MPVQRSAGPAPLKCFTKAAVAAPALALWGEKRKEGRRQRLIVLAQRQGAPCKRELWLRVPFGEIPAVSVPRLGRCQRCCAGWQEKPPSLLASPAGGRGGEQSSSSPFPALCQGSGRSLHTPRRAAAGLGEAHSTPKPPSTM